MLKRHRLPYHPNSSQHCYPSWQVEAQSSKSTKTTSTTSPTPTPTTATTASDSQAGNYILTAVILLITAGIWKMDGNSDATQASLVPTTRVEKTAPVPKSKPEKKPRTAPEGKSTATAVWAEDILPRDAHGFIKEYARYAQREHIKFGIPASITLAQGLIESAAGLSDLAMESNNLFGIKCFANPHTPGCCVPAYDDHNGDSFKKYSNPKISIRAHSKLLQKGLYKACYGDNNWARWARELKKAGYATDAKYAEKIIDCIQRYELWRFDAENAWTPEDVK